MARHDVAPFVREPCLLEVYAEGNSEIAFSQGLLLTGSPQRAVDLELNWLALALNLSADISRYAEQLEKVLARLRPHLTIEPQEC
jgi:hypothetical protein